MSRPMDRHGHIARRSLLAGAALLGVDPALAQPPIDVLDARMARRERYFQALDEAAPDFALQDADGHAVTLVAPRGKTVVLTFIYTLCPDVCPLISERVAKIQTMTKTTPLHDDLAFVSITADPVRDGPDAMKSYGAQHGLDASNWTFLTSGPARPDATRALSLLYHNRYQPEADGSITHGVVFHVIDAQGRLRGNFRGLDWKPDNLVFFLQALAALEHKPAGAVSSFLDTLQNLF